MSITFFPLLQNPFRPNSKSVGGYAKCLDFFIIDPFFAVGDYPSSRLPVSDSE